MLVLYMGPEDFDNFDYTIEEIEQMEDEYNNQCFEEIFLTELYSLFDTDFFLCDNCISEFLEEWEGVAVTNPDLKDNPIPLLSIYYKSSRFHCSDEDFVMECKKMVCPYCGNTLIDNIWPYGNAFVDFNSKYKELETSAKLVEKWACQRID